MVEQLQVVDDDSYKTGASILEIAATRIAAVEQEFERDKVTAHGMHKSITDRIKRWTDPYRKIRADIEAKLGPYLLQLEAAKATHEEAIKTTGEAAKQDLLEQAKAARRRGDIKAARALEEQAESVMIDVVLPDSIPKVAGLQAKRPWVGVVDAPMELILAVAEGRFPLAHKILVAGKEQEVPILMVSEQVVTYYAKKLEASMKIPGCTAKKDVSFARKKG
jgi:hypothetical protein